MKILKSSKIISIIAILLLSTKAYAIDGVKVKEIMNHCVAWGAKITSTKNIQQHIVACQRRNILVNISKKKKIKIYCQMLYMVIF